MSKTILIVEDNALNLKLFTDLFQSKGYRTVQATDGQEAVDAALHHRPDLVLMDIQLPTMSGLEATAIIKADENSRHIPIIAVTAFALTSDEARAREAGCDGYVAKPVSVYQLLDLVAGFIGPAGKD
jgi:two-component system, cell cycle response regulator DivK